MENPERDYWMRDLNTQDEFRDAPASYQRSLHWLRVLTRNAVSQYMKGTQQELAGVEDQLNEVTAHSARVTLLDAAVHAGRSTEEIGLQANWKNPGPLVLKYTRNRTSVPAHMVQQLVQDMIENEHPLEPPEGAVLDGGDQRSLDDVQFFVKASGARRSQDYRYHCSKVGEIDEIACGRVSAEDCTAMGSTFPDSAVLCKHCAAVRSDIAARCFSVGPGSVAAG